MPLYQVAFYRADETEPYHSWAPFGALDDFQVRMVVRRNIERNVAKGGTLAACTRYAFWEAETTVRYIVEEEV